MQLYSYNLMLGESVTQHTQTLTPSHTHTRAITLSHTCNNVTYSCMHVCMYKSKPKPKPKHTHTHTYTLFRGFLERVKFAVHLSHHRAQEQHHQLMVDYGQRVNSDRENNLLKTFKRKDFTPSEGEHYSTKHIHFVYMLCTQI